METLIPVVLDEDAWRALLESTLGEPVDVRFNRSRRRVIEIRPAEAGKSRTVRLNALFGQAPAEVRDAVLAWARSGRRAARACRTLDGWIEANFERLASTPPRRERLQARGQVHDLEQLAEGLRRDEFGSEFARPGSWPAIGWSRRGRSRTRHSLSLGSFDARSRRLRVHRVLDQEAVPGWFVGDVLRHELLHACLPPEQDRAGRSLWHGPAFRAREAAHPDHARARAWQEANLNALIRSARTGRPMSSAGAERRLRRVHAGAVEGGLRWIQGLLFGS